jgi:DNA topoisomerase I
LADKTLVIVESPAKAKTINKYLGSKYIVKASVGHIKDLETYRLGVDVKNDFKPKYVTIKGKADVIKDLKTAAGNSKNVLIATDPDREGEAIAWHIAEEVKTKNKDIKRVLFNEITKNGIKKGLEKPLEINDALFMSQQARRVMDRLIGYKVSPFLSKAMIEKTDQTLSAGRVQSVALRLICERDDEIRAFVPMEYWNIFGSFETENKNTLRAKLVAFGGKNIKNPEGSAKASDEKEQAILDKKIKELHYINDKKQLKALIAAIEKEKYKIDGIATKKIKRNPNPPFTTSSLQQEASRRLGFSNKKTMMLAQRLYEGVSLGDEGMVGLITYMRTDSIRISPEAQQAAKEFIEKNYGKSFVPSEPTQFKSKSKGVQDAHEAIRPTTLEYSPEFVRKNIDKDLSSLYELVFNRFLASQMSPASIDQTTVNIQGGEFTFRATGNVVTFRGFLAVYDDLSDDSNGDDKESTNLPPDLKDKTAVDLKETEEAKSQTKPKPRFTEASVVKELDELGIGRPSTYAAIISTLTERNYVELQKKSFIPTELGHDVNKVLVHNFPDLFNVEFTAEMENELDFIADGDKTYSFVLGEFYHPFTSSLERAEKSDSIPEIPCEKCGSPMTIKVGKKGRFLGCSNYPTCDFTKPLPTQTNKTFEKKELVIAEGVSCPVCNSEMYLREGRFGKFYGCVNYPKCKGILPFTVGVKCPKCNEGTLLERFSKKGRNKKFWGCSAYPKCDHLTNYEPIHKACPECNYYFLEYHFRKVDENYEKYIKCPSCKKSYELNEIKI